MGAAHAYRWQRLMLCSCYAQKEASRLLSACHDSRHRLSAKRDAWRPLLASLPVQIARPGARVFELRFPEEKQRNLFFWAQVGGFF